MYSGQYCLSVACDGPECTRPRGQQTFYYGDTRAGCREQSLHEGWLLARNPPKAFCNECREAYLARRNRDPWKNVQVDRNMMPLPRKA